MEINDLEPEEEIEVYEEESEESESIMSDYDGIARIKRHNKGMRFADENELHAANDRVIEEINLNNEATGIRHLPQRWAMVTQTGGEYIV